MNIKIILGAIVAVVVIGAGFFFMQSSAPRESNETEVPPMDEPLTGAAAKNPVADPDASVSSEPDAPSGVAPPSSPVAPTPPAAFTPPAPPPVAPPPPPPAAPIAVSSSAFVNNGTIPVQYTCDGQDARPPLSISNVPDGTVSFSIIMDDPDAPNGTTTHWTAWNITSAAVNISGSSLPLGTVQGAVYTGQSAYAGPCPPPGDPAHRYVFKLYALDTTLSLGVGASRSSLEAAMSGHVVAQAQLIGRYASPAN